MSVDKQELRNALSAIEDEARGWRKGGDAHEEQRAVLTLIAKLAQIVRQEIVK